MRFIVFKIIRIKFSHHIFGVNTHVHEYSGVQYNTHSSIWIIENNIHQCACAKKFFFIKFCRQKFPINSIFSTFEKKNCTKAEKNVYLKKHWEKKNINCIITWFLF